MILYLISVTRTSTTSLSYIAIDDDVVAVVMCGSVVGGVCSFPPFSLVVEVDGVVCSFPPFSLVVAVCIVAVVVWLVVSLWYPFPPSSPFSLFSLFSFLPPPLSVHVYVDVRGCGCVCERVWRCMCVEVCVCGGMLPVCVGGDKRLVLCSLCCPKRDRRGEGEGEGEERGGEREREASEERR